MLKDYNIQRNIACFTVTFPLNISQKGHWGSYEIIYPIRPYAIRMYLVSPNSSTPTAGAVIIITRFRRKPAQTLSSRLKIRNSDWIKLPRFCMKTSASELSYMPKLKRMELIKQVFFWVINEWSDQRSKKCFWTYWHPGTWEDHFSAWKPSIFANYPFVLIILKGFLQRINSKIYSL